MSTSPYAVPLAALLHVHVPADAQVTEQAAPRLQHLPGDPVLWAVGGLPGDGGAGGAGGGGGCGGGGGGDC